MPLQTNRVNAPAATSAWLPLVFFQNWVGMFSGLFSMRFLLTLIGCVRGAGLKETVGNCEKAILSGFRYSCAVNS